VWGPSWPLGHFSTYLAAVVRRNLPLGSSLSAYAQDFGGYPSRELVAIADAVDSGQSLADALDARPWVFPAYYRALVRAGESGGNLARILDRLAETVDANVDAGRRAVRHSLYPAVVVVLNAFIVFFLISLIVPKFADMMHEMSEGETGTPASMRVLVGATGFLVDWWYCFPLALFAMWALSLVPWVRKAWSWLVWNLPFFSRYERRRAVSQYALAAGNLMEAGVPMHEALSVAVTASGNERFDEIARVAAERVGEGSVLADALKAADYRRRLPPWFMWYVEVGERSGRLPEALVKASEGAAARSRRLLSGMANAILPVGIILVGLAVGGLAYAVFDWMVLLMREIGP
jgi:type II secretory pathway component PulF